MDPDARERIERAIRERFEAGDLQGAATAGLRGYGPEIFGVLVSLQRDEAHAAEVFSEFTERLWRGLDRFAWESSFRTWAFTIARNASKSHAEAAQARARALSPLPSGSALSALAAQIRTETLPYLRTEVKDGFARLRQALPEDDRLLLVLRVDKGMSWNEVARVLQGNEGPGDAAAEKREAARLRQRFATLKRELLERAKEAGLA
jgi:RNA polymerase sigma-70 factor (ECF subfamily)